MYPGPRQPISGALHAPGDDLETLRRLDNLFARTTRAAPEPYDDTYVDAVRTQGGEVLVQVDRFLQRWRRFLDVQDRIAGLPYPETRAHLGARLITENLGTFEVHHHPASGRVVLSMLDRYVLLGLTLAQTIVCYALSELTLTMTLHEKPGWIPSRTLPPEALETWVHLWRCPLFVYGASDFYLHTSHHVLVARAGAHGSGRITFHPEVSPELHERVLEQQVPNVRWDMNVWDASIEALGLRTHVWANPTHPQRADDV